MQGSAAYAAPISAITTCRPASTNFFANVAPMGPKQQIEQLGEDPKSSERTTTGDEDLSISQKEVRRELRRGIIQRAYIGEDILVSRRMSTHCAKSDFCGGLKWSKVGGWVRAYEARVRVIL